MPRQTVVPTLSGVPEGKEKPVRAGLEINFVESIRLLTDILTPKLCELVFKKVRKTERERKWSFAAIVRFWTAMIIRHPDSLTEGLAQTTKKSERDELWPEVMASPQAFFQKCAQLRTDFFQALYSCFTNALLPEAPVAYASWFDEVKRQFPELRVVDGSRLDSICHRLKILWPVRTTIHGGCITVLYDLYRGITRQVFFYGDAAKGERTRALDALEHIPSGTLLLGDRLYCMLGYFERLAQKNVWGLFRRNRVLKVKRLKVLSFQTKGDGYLEDMLVAVGARGQKLILRMVCIRSKGRRLDLLTNVLDPERLSAEQAVALYGMRWSVERMFQDLKETMKLGVLYASHPNLVAQQVYASAMVYNAFRVVQARIAAQADVLPEQLSSAKLFPHLAQATSNYSLLQWTEIRIRELNREVKINFPDAESMPGGTLLLKRIILTRRKGKRRVRSFRHGWKSIAQIVGGKKLLSKCSLN